MAMLTRRAFVGGTVAAAAAMALGACGRGGSDGAQQPSENGNGSQSDNQNGQQSTTPSLDDRVSEVLQGLTLEQKVAQLFFVRPESLTGIGQATAAGDATKEGFAKYPVGGVCYFGQNLLDPDQARSLIENSKQYALDACGLPLLASVDEEGGTVARIANNEGGGFSVENVGDAADIGATGDTSKATEAAQTIASYLTDLGFNADFAPVCDVANNPESTTMARRSFGSDADLVAEMASAEVTAFLDGGIIPCAKHFPGIGGAVGDSHEQAITSDKTLEEMEACELKPFEAAIEAGVPLVMVGHLSCPNVTGDTTPASLSSTIMEGVLRDQLGFKGVIITDSFEMGAVETLFSNDQQGVEILKAGADMVLMPIDFEAAYQGVLDAVNDGTLGEDRIDESVERVVRLKLERLA